MDKIKIQLNSLEALEKLISGDEKLEFEIKNSVVQSFVTKHLKGIANERIVKNAELSINKIVDSDFFTKYNTTVKPEYFNALKDRIDWRLRELVIQYVNSAVGIDALQKEISKRIENVGRLIEEELLSSNLERRIDALVEKRIKERLGIK